MKRYLVTGGAGFIGANFVKYLLEKWGDRVSIVILDKLTYAGNLMTIKQETCLPNVEFVKGDIDDAELVPALLKKHDPDYIVNFAAESHVDRSITNPRLFLETNVLGTQNLLECARESWLEGKAPDGRPRYREGRKFLQISTDEVYGSMDKEYDNARPLKVDKALREVVKGRRQPRTYGSGLFTENSPLSPHSPYSASKAAADMMVMAYHDTYGLPVNITRCSNNYGPYHFPEKLIPLAIMNTLSGTPIPVYAKGENVRDWLYVGDHAKAVDMVLREGRIGETYNIGGFNEERNIDIVKTIISEVVAIVREQPHYRSLLKCPVEETDERLISFVADRPGHDMRYAIDPTKIATQLGWYPETPFDQGIKMTIRWYMENQSWVEEVTSGEYRKYYEEMYNNRQ